MAKEVKAGAPVSTDIAAFQQQFSRHVLAYAKSRGYGHVVRHALNEVGVTIPQVAVYTIKVTKEITNVEDADQIGKELAGSVGGVLDDIDIDD